MTAPVAPSRSSATAVAALLVQLAVGYEWLVSGFTKLHRGDFPDGLAAALDDAGKGAPAWYRGFLTGTIVPHAHAFGYAIEVAEILVGLVLVVCAFAPLLAGDRISPRLSVAACSSRPPGRRRSPSSCPSTSSSSPAGTSGSDSRPTASTRASTSTR